MQAISRLFSEGGVAMYPLALCSVLTVAVVINRVVFYVRGRVDPHRFVSELRRLMIADGLTEGAAVCREDPAPVAKVCLAAIEGFSRGEEAMATALSNSVKVQHARLNRYLNVLGTIGNVAPFIGLFGTVLGILHSFHEIARTGKAGSAVVAAGVAEALVATAAGLGVAIVAVVCYNWLTNWADSFQLDMELAASEIAEVMPEVARVRPHEEVA